MNIRSMTGYLLVLIFLATVSFISPSTETVSARDAPPTRMSGYLAFNTTEDEPFKIDLENISISGDNLSYSLVEGPSWLEMGNGSMFGTPGNDDVGWSNFTLNITSTTEQLLINISICVLNIPPTIVDGSIDPMAWEDRSYLSRFELREDGDRWTISLAMTGPGNFTWLHVYRNGRVSGTPRNVHVGNWTVNLTLDDMNGGIAYREWSITVVNEPPNITVKDYGTVFEWVEKTIDFDCSSEGDDATFYEIVSTNLLNYTLDRVTGMFTFNPGHRSSKQCYLIVKVYDIFGGIDEIVEEFEIFNSPAELITVLPTVFIAGEIKRVDLDTNEDSVYGLEFGFERGWPAFTDLLYTKGSPFLHYGIIRFLPWNVDAGFHSYILSIKDTDSAVSRYFWNFTVMRNGSFIDPVVDMEVLEITSQVIRLRVEVNGSGQRFASYPLSPRSSVDLFLENENLGSRSPLSSVNIGPDEAGMVELPRSNISGRMEIQLSVYFEHLNGTYRMMIKTLSLDLTEGSRGDSRNGGEMWILSIFAAILLLIIMSIVLLVIENTSYALQMLVFKGGDIDEGVLSLVHDRPGIHFRELRRAARMKRRDLVSTLVHLERTGNVKPIPDGTLVRFYPTVGSFVDGPLVLTRQQQRIAESVAGSRKLSIQNLSDVTGGSKKKLERETTLMELKGILHRKKGRDGNEYYMSSKQKKIFKEWKMRGDRR
ncbi:MAG: hypothetical protein JXA22_01755 [Candidatus Thermoplasmatota archaeon]|nr:hypothetical protein [Candidatus Thermoplasmatota archaeon]